MNRRQFLKTGTASALSMSGLSSLDVLTNPAHALVNPSDFKTLVCVFLDGGNDSFNMLIPNSTAEYAEYAKSRQEFAFDRSAMQAISPKGLGANSFALHPSMSAIKNLFNNAEASVIANAGPLIQTVSKSDYANGSAVLPSGIASHAEGQAYWKADHDNSENTTQDGIGGRIANEFVNSAELPINISSNSGYDLFLSHSSAQFYDLIPGGIPTIPDYKLGGPFGRPPATARRNALNKAIELAREDQNLFIQHAGDLLSQGLELNLKLQSLLSQVKPLDVQFPRSPIGSKLKRAAELISIREPLSMNRQIIFARVDGFDLHGVNDSNVSALDVHARLMLEVSEAMSAFNEAMKELSTHSSTLTYTASEFGRTLTNNGNGTDHGWGGNQILMGGAIKGGELFGNYPILELNGDEDYNGDGRFIPSTSTTQVGATIAKWFGVPQNRLNAVFPNLTNFSGREDLGFF